MVRDFLAWWGGQLAQCVPEAWRRLASSTRDGLVIAPVGRLATPSDVVVVSVRRNGRENLLGRYPLSSGGLIDVPRSGGVSPVLRLSETDLLIKTVTLPLAAERDLGQVLAFEMDRETPFSAAEVFWTHRIIDRDHERGRISVQLYLIPRARLRSLLDALGSAGIAVKRAEVADGPTETIDLPLDNDDRAQAAANRNLLRWPAVALCAGLAIAVIVTPFARQASTEGALDEAIARGRSAATEAEKIRNEIQNLSGSAELVNSERDKAGRPLAVLAAVTQMLPADTYLTEFRQQQQKVSINGRSGGASRLIAALSASDRLRNPAFAAPVTRIDAIRAEVFTINAEVVP